MVRREEDGRSSAYADKRPSSSCASPTG